jgi:hypothetical protein
MTAFLLVFFIANNTYSNTQVNTSSDQSALSHSPLVQIQSIVPIGIHLPISNRPELISTAASGNNLHTITNDGYSRSTHQGKSFQDPIPITDIT